MLYCRDCGQCIHISDSNFIQFMNTSGWESNAIDPIDGDYIDYLNGETTDSEHDSTECPNCRSSNVDWEVDPTAQEAQILRDSYNKKKNPKKSKEKSGIDSL